MKKILLFIIMLWPLECLAISLPDTYSDKVLIYDLTDDVMLFSKRANEETNIASLTKIMTTILAIEKNPDISKKVVITSDVFAGLPSDASVADLRVDDTLSIEDLLYASILPSGADATQALAIVSSGSVPAFVDEMNALAVKIGADNTSFKNVTGLDEVGHYSTAYDILLILKYALSNDLFKRIYCTREYTMSNGEEVKSTLLLYAKNIDFDISSIQGSKTGYTSKAGVCISVLTTVNGHDFLIITLGAPQQYGKSYNLIDVMNIRSFLLNNYQNQVLVNKNQEVLTIPVELSKKNSYKVLANKTITKFLPSDYDNNNLRIEYHGKNLLSYKDNKGDYLGDILYYYDNTVLDKEEVVLNENLNMDVIKVLKKNRTNLIISSLIAFLAVLIIKIIGKNHINILKH